MPPFFDWVALQTAIRTRALPALEELAANPNLLEKHLDNRFDRDDPPAYVSSSESEAEEALYNRVLALPREAALEKFEDLVSKPLNDDERLDLIRRLDRIHMGMSLYSPGSRYDREMEQERDRLDRFYRSTDSSPHADELLKWPTGYKRRDVIVRHNIRKRWEGLGIWNPEWGIPGRVNRQPNDDISTWKWKWQSTADPPAPDPRHPISRAVQLRRNLAYGEHVPPPPRSHLRDNASASEAESFIISRPWFTHTVEHAEFRTREWRIPVELRGRGGFDGDHPVTKRWKERGDWRPRRKWRHESPSPEPKDLTPLNTDDRDWRPRWKWHHESPSPEPEDLTPLNTDDMDFTPSEVDAFETVHSPSPEPRPSPPAVDPSFAFYQYRASTPLDALLSHAAWIFAGPGDEPEDQLVPDAEEQPPNPPPRRRGRPRKQSQRPAVAAAPPPPPPRRSAKIAARNASSLPPPLSATSRATRARMPRGVPAAPPPGSAPSSAADAPKKRGRPRKTQGGGITILAAPVSKRVRRHSGRIAAAAAAAAAADMMVGKVTKGVKQ